MEKEAIQIPGFLRNLGGLFKSAPKPASNIIDDALLGSMINGKKLFRGGEAYSYLPTPTSPANSVIKVLQTSKPTFDVNNLKFGKMDGFLRSYNVEPRFDQKIMDAMKWRNMVPGMAQTRQLGVDALGRPVLEQPFIKGIDASFRDVRNWFKDNNVAQLRKGNENVIGMPGISRKSPQGYSNGVAARAGVARVSDPIAGFIPRSRYLLMDDIKPQNFQFDFNLGKAVPIDIMANPITRRQAWQVPQIRRQMLKSYLTRFGVGATSAAGMYGLDQNYGIKDKIMAYIQGQHQNTV